MTKRNKQLGFTLLESLVAIAIVLVAISTAFTIVPQGQVAVRFIKNRMVASYLAQEAIEVVRNHRDHYMLYNTKDGAPSPDWRDTRGASNYSKCVAKDFQMEDPPKCMVNSYFGTESPKDFSYFGDQFTLCSDDDCELLMSKEVTNAGQTQTVYGNGGTGARGFDGGDSEETIYTRWVTVVPVTNNVAAIWEEEATNGASGGANSELIKNDIELKVTSHVSWNDKGEQQMIERSTNLFYWFRPFDHGYE